MTRTILLRLGAKASIAAGALALLALLAHPRPALAQQPWSTPDASGNIHNTNTGNVGVGTGTATPNGVLDVFGLSAHVWVGRSSPTLPDGNTSPRLVVGDTAALNPGILTLVSNDTTSGDSVGALSFANYALGGTDKRIATIAALLDGGSDSGALIFNTWNAGAYAEAMRINRSGSVGIGTQSPSASYKLDVNGGARVSGDVNVTGTLTGGNIQAKYQDVAEWVPSSKLLAAGTVVVLDASRNNQVTSSSKAYDTKVAGVVSPQPGIALGEKGEGKALVATTGRVRVKVDATHAPIAVGDLLVTSDVEGVAMKSVPVDLGGVQIHRPGTIIGKALEPLDKGTGEILVLLSLQ